MNNEFIKIYVNFLKKFLEPAKPFRVVFDCSNGTTDKILKYLKTKKLKTFFINNKPDGNFPAHGPNPLAPNATNQLQKEVIKQKADLGIIFDADGDRAFFINNKGKFINSDVIANLLIWRLNPKKVVIDVRTGYLIKKPQLLATNYQLLISQVGHYFIKKLMRKIDADFGAEQSGHYYFKKFFYCDSGIMAAIEVINAVSKLPYKLSDYIDLLPQYYRSSELNFKIENSKRFIKKIEKCYNSKSKNYLDGLTMEFTSLTGEWRFNLRSSNTEPLLRLNIEATNKNLLRQKIKEFKKLLK